MSSCAKLSHNRKQTRMKCIRPLSCANGNVSSNNRTKCIVPKKEFISSIELNIWNNLRLSDADKTEIPKSQHHNFICESVKSTKLSKNTKLHCCLKRFGRAIDRILCDMNVHYAFKVWVSLLGVFASLETMRGTRTMAASSSSSSNNFWAIEWRVFKTQCCKMLIINAE